MIVNKFFLISFFRYVLGEILSSRQRDVIVENIQDYLRSGKLLTILLQHFFSRLYEKEGFFPVKRFVKYFVQDDCFQEFILRRRKCDVVQITFTKGFQNVN